LIEFTFLQGRLRAKSKIENRCGLRPDRQSYPVSYPQSVWATFPIPGTALGLASRSGDFSRTLMDARSAVQKRIVTMLRPHNTTLSNLE